MCEVIGSRLTYKRFGQGQYGGSLREVGQMYWALLLPSVHPLWSVTVSPTWVASTWTSYKLD